SDSEYAVRSLTNRLDNAEDEGWTGIKNHHWIKETIEAIREKRGAVAICWTKAHANDPGNDKADELA
ncbi:hypothetical protein AGABI2DRAFT_46858, partial [Agaricus bisporus var. bisporus H97]|uniref:hypothetical protein n=1 Tax=Agaricus bisporus var. bisporus (strain H97 / ATCC MYA-4626 / FGSC 10389) TaxID=936046 RepID=UPI00029F7929